MARPRRALVIVHSYYLRDTRPRRHATALADAGWAVDVLCARDEAEPARERRGSVTIHRLPARRKRGSRLRYVFEYVSFAFLAALAATWLNVRRRYSLVYVVGIPNFLVFAAAVPRATGARVVLDMRDPLPEFFMAKYGLRDDDAIVRALLAEERISCAFAHAVLAPHDACAELYARAVDRSRIAVVMNLPDPKVFDPRPRAHDPADRTMLFTGTVAARYGVDLAVRALAILRDEVPGLRLRVVGDGDLVPRLRTLARELGVEDRLQIDRPVPLDEIPAIVAAAWVGVQPNRDDPLMRYSFSTKVLEWCRLGLPVVAGATAGLAASFSADELLLHEPGDVGGLCARIKEAHADPAGLAARVERARAAAERFDFEEQIATFLRVVVP